MIILYKIVCRELQHNKYHFSEARKTIPTQKNEDVWFRFKDEMSKSLQ